MNSVYIFGAGKLGIRAYEAVKELEYSKITYCDNDKKKWDTVILGCKVCSFEEMYEEYCKEKLDIIIASGAYQDMYNQCILNNMEITGIYEENSGKILSYRELSENSGGGTTITS